MEKLILEEEEGKIYNTYLGGGAAAGFDFLLGAHAINGVPHATSSFG